MDNNVEQLIFDRINKAHRFLITVPQNPNGDALGAGLAFYGFLKKLKKEAEIVCSAPDLMSWRFLPNLGEIRKTLTLSQSFVVSLKTGKAQLEELSYEVNPEQVDIFLKPKKGGKFSPEDVSFKSGKFPYDLIVTLDTPSLDHLGEVYENNRDLFFETTVVNIDHHPNNEHYGEINFVDLTATSSSEILASLIEDFESGLIDEAIATALLTGIIVETNSFQHVKTTPAAFLAASNLIAKGGKHKEIIRELYKTKDISMLKLWGRALARLKEIKDLGLAYSLVNLSDLEKSGSSAQDIFGVMKELVANLAGQRIVLFLAETAPREIIGYFHLHPSIKSQIVTAALSGQMLNGAFGVFQVAGSDLLTVEKDILEKLAKISAQIAV
jgi:nanoRNase/pAp phosphatase (c-di-AMP/oligoRNAs hydrolase)